MAEMFRGKYEPGTVFQFENQWYVADKNGYISTRDAYDADDINDVQIEVGWNTTAHLATSDHDLALVAAYQEEEARKEREWHAKYDPIHARLAAAAAQKAAAKKAEQITRMHRDYQIGMRVQNGYISNLVGHIVAHHESEPKVSVQWDGKDQPACIGNSTHVTWFGLNDLRIVKK